MKGRINLLFRDKFLLYSLTLTAIFLTISVLLVVFSYKSLPPLIPLFNSMPWGVTRLYSSEVVLILPLVFLLVILINTTITLLIYNRFTLLSRLITFNSFLVCLLGALAYLQILFLIY